MANSMWVMLLCSARNFHAFHSFIIRLWGTSDFSLNWSLITSDPHDQQRVSVTASFSFPGLCAMTNRMWVTLYFLFYKQCYHISWLAGCESWFCYQEPYSFSAYNQQTVSDSVHLDRAAPPHTYILSYYYCTVTINTLYAPMRRYPVCFLLLLYYTATLPMLDWYGHHHSITTITSCITPCLTLAIVLLTYDTLFPCSGYVSPLFTNTVHPWP